MQGKRCVLSSQYDVAMHIPLIKPGRNSPGFPLLLLIVCLSLLLAAQTAHARQAMLLPVAPLQLNQHTVQAEVAATEASRNQGLMFRTSLPPDQGMLFVFQAPTRSCFWMKNTLIPLSIAFIDNDGRIINILDMQPQSLENHCPDRAMQFALEMPQGWFRKAGVRSGDLVSGLPATD